MVLYLKDFIENHKDWYNILSNPPYSIAIKQHDNLYLFKYSIDTEWRRENYNILKECRGAIYHIEDGIVECIHMGLLKFFNYEEPNNDIEPIFNECEVLAKMDGTNISFWYYNSWHCSTLGCIDASEAELSCGFTAEDLVNDVLGEDYKQYCERELDKKCSYIFELIHPKNQIVIKYNKKALYFITARNHITWDEEYTLPQNATLPRAYRFDSLSDIIVACLELPNDEEGYVVVNRNTYERVKIKGAAYIQLHYIRGNGNLTIERYLELRDNESLDDFIAAFPSQKEYADLIYQKIQLLNEDYERLYKVCMQKQFSNRKELANFIKGNEKNSYVFARFDNKIKNFYEWFNIQSMSKKKRLIENVQLYAVEENNYDS